MNQKDLHEHKTEDAGLMLVDPLNLRGQFVVLRKPLCKKSSHAMFCEDLASRPAPFPKTGQTSDCTQLRASCYFTIHALVKTT